MIIRWSIIKQELLTVFSKVSYYVETIVGPLTFSLIALAASSGRGPIEEIVHYVLLITLYGVLQSMLLGSARSLDKERYQDTLQFHFLANINLWIVVLNKLIANGIVGIVNLVFTVILLPFFTQIAIFHLGYLALGFVLLLCVSTLLSLVLSCFFLRLKAPEVVCSVLNKLVLLMTGIFVPLHVFPQPLVWLLSLSGLPQVFSLILYGLSNEMIVPGKHLAMLPFIIVIYVYFGIKLIEKVEVKYLKVGGI